ncbi:MAG: family 78 glycoside hydrolase catalytic domain [Clostridia bacterium]|nr:family 78 glycoside hydrolase catalytic domain [Clostridia bacterium]
MLENAKWIWPSEIGEKNTYGEFIATLDYVRGAKMNISCDGDYTLYINGKYVASNQYGDYEHYKIYDTIELDSFLVKGKNTIAILVWHFGEGSSRYILSKPGLIFEVVNESGVVLSSDENVLSRKSRAYKSGEIARISPQLGFGFEYDATLEDGWKGGEKNGFSRSYIIDKKCTFFARPYKKLSVGEICATTCLKSEDGTHFLYSLGKEQVGFISFNINATEKTKIIVAYGEHIIDGGVRRLVCGHDFSIKYTAKAGENEFTNHMLRLGAKYIEIFAEKPIEVNKIGIIPHYVPVIRKKDDLSGIQKKIYDICLNTLEKCMQEHYVDCPWREGCLYAFDSRNQMMCGYYAFEGGNFDYARSNLILMSKDRRDDGLMSICYPCGIDLTIPSFSLHYISAVLEYLIYSGDKSLVYEVNPKMKELLCTFLSNRENGLITKFEGTNHWNFYDWSPYLEGRIWHNEEKTPDVTLSLMVIIALKAYKEICMLTALDFEYENDIDSISKATKEAFFDKERGLFRNVQNENEPLELTNSLGVLSGVLSREETERVCEHLISGKLTTASLSTRRFVYDALLMVDKEKYSSFILSDIEKNYKIMLDQGADTVWETIEGANDFDGAGSFCHGWSAIPIYYYNELKGLY